MLKSKSVYRKILTSVICDSCHLELKPASRKWSFTSKWCCKYASHLFLSCMSLYVHCISKVHCLVQSLNGISTVYPRQSGIYNIPIYSALLLHIHKLYTLNCTLFSSLPRKKYQMDIDKRMGHLKSVPKVNRIYNKVVLTDILHSEYPLVRHLLVRWCGL